MVGLRAIDPGHSPRKGLDGFNFIVEFFLYRVVAILGHRAGPARHGPGTGQARPGGCRAGMARRASRAVPLRASCLAISPSTGLWAVFHAKPAQEARLIQHAGLAQGPLHR